jgi:hypothetical protein
MRSLSLAETLSFPTIRFASFIKAGGASALSDSQVFTFIIALRPDTLSATSGHHLSSNIDNVYG